ncbi:MAG: S1C family serine protease [Kiloniellales bacterium]
MARFSRAGWVRDTCAALIAVAALALASQASAQVDRPERLLSSVVGLHAVVPADARTAGSLGTERRGSGVVIDDGGLVVTIGYLILEAGQVEVVDRSGRRSPADILAYDHASGFGLVRALDNLDAEPMALGDSSRLREDDLVIVASREDEQSAAPAVVVSRRSFAGYWEYLLESAIFTSPPRLGWGGAALIDTDGRLVGIGSLIVSDAAQGPRPRPGNMFVPIDELKPILADLLAQGRSTEPPRPWIGVYTEEAQGRLFVTRVATGGPAAQAGIVAGDIILTVEDQPVEGMADFYRKLWARGPAGVEVRLTVLHGTRTRDITIKSDDRYNWLKLKTAY